MQIVQVHLQFHDACLRFYMVQKFKWLDSKTKIARDTLKVSSYWDGTALWCWYIDYFLLQLTMFQVKMNLTLLWHHATIILQWVQCGNATYGDASMNEPSVRPWITKHIFKTAFCKISCLVVPEINSTPWRKKVILTKN